MQRLLDDLLELSRIGRIINPPQAVSFGAILLDAMELVAGQIAASGAQVVLEPNMPVVYGDRARLVEVLQNLLDNGLKFMGSQPHPRIEIGTQPCSQPGMAQFFVRDNGQGIEPRFHETVFGLFNKLDAHSDGTGVGLALVRRIIDVHGGKIWVESDGFGEGTTFCFLLPTIQDEGKLREAR
jgi:signal transduction histidine kinase